MFVVVIMILTLKILVEKDKERRVKTAERISKALKEIGINSEIVSVKRDVFLSKLRARDYSIYIGGLSLDGAMDMSSILKSDGENNFTGYSNRKVDGLLDEQFKLVLCCSEGTKYEDYIHELVELEVSRTEKYAVDRKSVV